MRSPTVSLLNSSMRCWGIVSVKACAIRYSTGTACKKTCCRYTSMFITRSAPGTSNLYILYICYVYICLLCLYVKLLIGTLSKSKNVLPHKHRTGQKKGVGRVGLGVEKSVWMSKCMA